MSVCVCVCINGCPLGKGRTSATAEMTATKVTAHTWQENWRHMDRNYVLIIFLSNLFKNVIKMEKELLLQDSET